MLPDPVTDRQVTGRPSIPFLGVLEGHCTDPFFAEGLDVPFGLIVGASHVGPGTDVLDLEDAASLGKDPGDLGRPVDAHHLTAFDALAVEPGYGPASEADRCGFLLIRENLHIGELRGVVDRLMDPFLTDTSGAALLSVGGDAVPRLAKPGQFFYVDANPFAWRLAS